ncbi:mitochondrial ribosomal protein L51 [Suhomyces tanzawaensis NRRL Y-17324]|uniref:Mitochondrial ribosomal protein L51 n=1 Tax=Suhomyces tanzawaensis NRRL Y-17324 TaxID=984487 RepID=A0A1E4SLZ5_9ASCO|nr:mitochondrial ribosomal protein L51 [Suhomyces tanzawaensis NRRL Y-17324]ODV80508.1 mitochondrial ribosomal protein L51 [Suhomyces tanzawaensis NRRL Y-17324]
MNSQELFNLVKNSKLAQVATPLLKNIRGKSAVPTHQIIYTPKSSAIRSNFGIKTTLPKQIGNSHIAFNDIDNYKNMPDVEKFSGKLHNRLKFQETGLVLRNHYSESNPLFPSKQNQSNSKLNDDSITNSLNLHGKVSPSNVRAILKENKGIYREFRQWLSKNQPQALLSPMSQSTTLELLKKFLASSENVTRKGLKLQDLIKADGKVGSTAISTHIQGTGGFSYNQKGRLTNTPNGVKYGVVAPGRLVGTKEAAIGGFVAGVNERTTLLQHNFARNSPGKHSRQFIVPFKVTEAEISEQGSIKLYADGVKAGKWMQSSNNESIDRSRYEASNPNFGSASERNKAEGENLQRLLNLIIQ